jgi:hypothetical protein
MRELLCSFNANSWNLVLHSVKMFYTEVEPCHNNGEVGGWAFAQYPLDTKRKGNLQVTAPDPGQFLPTAPAPSTARASSPDDAAADVTTAIPTSAHTEGKICQRVLVLISCQNYHQQEKKSDKPEKSFP